RESVHAVTGDSSVEFHCGDFRGFVASNACKGRVILVLVDADHRYDAVANDIAALSLMKVAPYAVAFHDFSLRYVNPELRDVRVDQAILDSFGSAVHLEHLGELAGEGITLRTSPGEDGHYHEAGMPEGVLLMCPGYMAG